MIGISGPSLLAKERAFLQKIQPAGVIYFKRNARSPQQLAKLSQSIQKLFPRAFSPLIGIDQEGGIVTRLHAPFTVFPGNDHLGRYYLRTGRTHLVRAQAHAMITELRTIGVNINFTPVADIHTNPRNPIIGQRAFGDSEKVVADLVRITISTYRRMGMISCAKHFPGHGHTSSDSHKVLPVVRLPRKKIFNRELRPFFAAISSHVPTIMTAHVIYPALDRKNPATLSPFILQNLLRKKLKFHGVIISDDLEMNAIAKRLSLADAAVKAISSGVDLLLVCKSLKESQEVYKRLFSAVQNGEINISRVRQALSKIRKLKKSYRIGEKFPQRMRRGWKWPYHRTLSQRVATYK